MVVYVTFLRDVACQKLLNSANVSRSYSQNNTGTVFFETRCCVSTVVCFGPHSQSSNVSRHYLHSMQMQINIHQETSMSLLPSGHARIWPKLLQHNGN